MWPFNKKAEGESKERDSYTEPVFINGKIYEVNEAVYNYITALEKDLYKVKGELEIIKPILENKDLKPAISKDCQDCKYAVKSRWNGDPLGCRKDNLCPDFTPMEE